MSSSDSLSFTLVGLNFANDRYLLHVLDFQHLMHCVLLFRRSMPRIKTPLKLIVSMPI